MRINGYGSYGQRFWSLVKHFRWEFPKEFATDSMVEMPGRMRPWDGM